MGRRVQPLRHAPVATAWFGSGTTRPRRATAPESSWSRPRRCLAASYAYWLEHDFPTSHVYQLRESDAYQGIYGLPEWMPAVQAPFLNESATLFRRKYYNNGSHAGFILYLTDSQAESSDVTWLREALKQARGPSNFRNLLVHSPDGKKDGLQIIPVSEVAARDEFANIKGVTRDDMLAALRGPPQLLGIVPQNCGGFGSIRDAATVWAAMELAPLQTRMAALNDWLGEQVIQFSAFELAPAVG